MPREIELETSSRTTAPKRRLRSSDLDGLEQVVRVVRDLGVAVARHAERRPLGDLHLREEPVEEVRDHRLERDQQPARADGDEARQRPPGP